MHCPTCGYDNPQPGRFCVDCGVRLPLRCPNCGAPIDADHKFCAACGQELHVASGVGAAPADYTPSYLADRIRAGRQELVGERKHVTVLFADLVGSTALIEHADPEEAAGLLAPALKAMMDAVHRYEGTVNEVAGDGIMALFGAPLAHEDHAVRGCYAALLIPELVGDATDHAVDVRVGLHSGEVLVRSIDNDLSMDYTAVGPTVHLAARMEQLAEPGTVLTTADTLARAEGFVEAEPWGPTEVKGIREPVPVHVLTGKTGVSTTWEARAARGLTSFVGREPELATLRRALDQLDSGKGQVVAIVGEPGVGKSRLAREFLASEAAGGYRVLEAGATPYDVNTTYYLFKSLIRAWFQVDSVDHGPDGLRTQVAAIDESLTPMIPALEELLDLPSDDLEWEGLGPVERRRRTRDALKALLVTAAARRPTVILIEDLQWLDGETQAVLDELVDALGAVPLMLVVTYRPEYDHEWTQKSFYTHVRLEPLTGPLAEEFLDALMGDHPSLGPLKPLLAKRSEGTPLFLEEYVRALEEARILEGRRGQYRAMADVGELRVPDRVQTVLASRIDRVPHDHKRVLKVAAVIGEDIPLALLQSIVSVPESELVTILADLQARELVYERHQLPSREYTFKHNLTREVTYEGVPQGERQKLHGRVVEQLETAYRGREREQIERLATHAYRAELWGKAATYAMGAADKAIDLSAYEEANPFLKAAIRALEKESDYPESSEQQIDARLKLRVVATATGKGFSAVLEELDRAEQLAEDTGDLRRQINVHIHQSYALSILGRIEPSVEAAASARRMATEIGNRYLIAESELAIAQAYAYAGYPLKVVELLSPNLDYLQSLELDRRGQTAIRGFVALQLLSVAHSQLGHFEEALDMAEQGRSTAAVAERYFDLSYSGYALGTVFVLRGDGERAIEILDDSTKIADYHDIHFVSAWLGPLRGHARTVAGKPDEAIPILEEVRNQAGARELPYVEASAEAYLAAALKDYGDAEGAVPLAERALNQAQTDHVPVTETFVLRVLADIEATRNSDRAVAHLSTAVEVAERAALRVAEAHARLDLGRLLANLGRHGQSVDHLTTAADLFEAMGLDHEFELAQRLR